MSRLTSAQVIGLGEYLEPDFEPTTLTVSQLLGVLGYHNVRYPTPYSKPKLVQLFNEEIKTRASKFKKERLKKENSIASDDGIVDGVTGQPLGATRKVLEIRMSSFCYLMSLSNYLETLPARRSSRRFSQVPVDVSQQPPDPVHLSMSWLPLSIFSFSVVLTAKAPTLFSPANIRRLHSPINSHPTAAL